MVDLRANPFFLDDDGIKWVNDVISEMTLDEKVGQLFCPMGYSDDDADLDHFVKELHVGALMYRMAQKDWIRNTHEKIQKRAKIPLLIAANTEAGGDGLCFEGTSFGKPLSVAATGDSENAYRMGYVACTEGAAVGLNWSFAPIIDIDMDFHNPITNVRTFGSSPEMVKKCGSAYMRGANEAGVAVSIKHFPGDGSDERDQHVVTSVNTLDADEWDKTYGYVYKSLIDEGAKTVMVGHIAQPAWVKRINPDATNAEMLMPASLSKYLVTDLLRGHLGFNGLVTTDSSAMTGFMAALPREKGVPVCIAAGCDMLLFNKNIEEDFAFMKAGIEGGIISEERLNDALMRILGTKAALKLHMKQKEGTLVPPVEALEVVGCEKHRVWARESIYNAVTLVKDTQNLLPVSPDKYKRVYLNVIEKKMNPDSPAVNKWKELFEKEGFEVVVRDRSQTIEMENFVGINMTPRKTELMDELYRPTTAFKKGRDLYVYIANVETASNNTTTRLDWNVVFGMGDDVPWFVEECPTMMISTQNPYHMFDAPQIKTFINAYANDDVTCAAVMDKIMGRSEFKGISPVDPFCGKEYLRMTGGYKNEI